MVKHTKQDIWALIGYTFLKYEINIVFNCCYYSIHYKL